MALARLNNVILTWQNTGQNSYAFRGTPSSTRISRPESSFHLNFPSNCGICASISDADSTLDNLKLDGTDTSTYSRNAWSEFAKRVSGEWDGFGADFSNEGKPVELPELVVPEAYREWEVKLYDWQTQCPTLAEAEEQILGYKSVQLLPTVGCEADAATRYRIDERIVGGPNNGVTAFAYQSSTGSYVAVWPRKDSNIMELEYCLINPQENECRVRIIQVVRAENTKMVLESIRIFREQWYGPFRNGEQLGGCAVRDSAFASTSPLDASQLTGVWQASTAVATFPSSSSSWALRELVEGNMQNYVRDGCNDISLPKQLWCSLNQGKDGETLAEVGWLLDHEHAITSRCIFFSTTKLKQISVSIETRGFEDA